MDAETVNSRIRAARALRRMEQTELDALFAADGLGKQEASRLERGELPLTAARRHALVRHLRVPEIWFTSENVDEIVDAVNDPFGSVEQPELAGVLAEISRRMEALEEQNRLLQAELATDAAEVLSRIVEVQIAIQGSQGPTPQ